MIDHLHLDAFGDRLVVLGALEPFRAIATTELIAAAAWPRRMRAGERTAPDGAPDPTVHVVVDGAVATARGPAGRAAVVGLHELLARGHGEPIVATAPSTLLELPASAVLDAYEQDPALLRASLVMTARALIARGRGDEPIGAPAPPAAARFPARLAEHLLALEATPLLAAARVEALIDLVRASEALRGGAGERLWRAGDPSDAWLIVAAGRLGARGNGGPARVILPGQTIGVLEALAGIPRIAAVVTESAWCGYRLAHADALELLESHVGLALGVHAALSASLLA